jgi:hypothetical protein
MAIAQTYALSARPTTRTALPRPPIQMRRARLITFMSRMSPDGQKLVPRTANAGRPADPGSGQGQSGSSTSVVSLSAI